MKNIDILIIGRMPPPIGGVTVHVQRLINRLINSSLSISHIEPKYKNAPLIIRNMLQCKVVHLHSSSVWLRFVFSLIAILTTKKVIITYHGNLGRYGHIKNYIDRLSVKYSTTPILLNKHSYDIAIGRNKRSVLMTAFIPPDDNPDDMDLLDLEALNKVDKLKINYGRVYCTNAYNVAWDSHGNETYSITQLIQLFANLKSQALVISDPSSKYWKYLKERNITLPNNVNILSHPHKFHPIINHTDGFIRATTTDGDSISVREAIYYGKRVYCSDCVDRPEGVILFKTNDYEQLGELLTNHYQDDYRIDKSMISKDCIQELQIIYNSFIDR